MAIITVEKLNRHQKASVGESIGRQLDFYTVRTLLDITPGEVESESQERLNALIQTISLRGQPIIVNVADVVQETDPADLTGAAAGVPVDVYTMKFAIEHQGAWEGSTPSLVDTLVAGGDFEVGNLSIQFHESL